MYVLPHSPQYHLRPSQVYRAKLKPEYALEDGTVRVAVKVRRPNVVQVCDRHDACYVLTY